MPRLGRSAPNALASCRDDRAAVLRPLLPSCCHLCPTAKRLSDDRDAKAAMQELKSAMRRIGGLRTSPSSHHTHDPRATYAQANPGGSLEGPGQVRDIDIRLAMYSM